MLCARNSTDWISSRSGRSCTLRSTSAKSPGVTSSTGGMRNLNSRRNCCRSSYFSAGGGSCARNSAGNLASSPGTRPPARWRRSCIPRSACAHRCARYRADRLHFAASGRGGTSLLAFRNRSRRGVALLRHRPCTAHAGVPAAAITSATSCRASASLQADRLPHVVVGQARVRAHHRFVELRLDHLARRHRSACRRPCTGARPWD